MTVMRTLLTHEWLRTRGRLALIAGIAALIVAVGALAAATRWVLVAPVGAIGAVAAAYALVPVSQLLLAFD